MRILMAAGLAAAVTLIAQHKQEYLGELDYASQNVLALAEAIPVEKYSWRPGPGVRSLSEVLVHIAAGNYLLLDIARTEGHAKALIAENQELEKTVTEKERVLALLKRALAASRKAFETASASDLEKRVDFFGRERTARAVHLRLLVHLNEHAGQLVAYARMNGVAPPWSK